LPIREFELYRTTAVTEAPAATSRLDEMAADKSTSPRYDDPFASYGGAL
jgi:hypothetical protein